MSGGPAVSLRWVETADDIPPALWEHCFPAPLEGHWWYLLLERSGLESQFRFAYGVILRDGEPVGIVPTFLMDVPIDLVAPPLVARCARVAGAVWRALRFQRTLFVGSPGADAWTIGLLPGVELADIAVPVERALGLRREALGASMLVFKDMPADAAAALAPLVVNGALFSFPSLPGTRLLLPAGGFGPYLGSLASRHRHNLAKKLKGGAQVCPLERSVTRELDERTLSEVVGLYSETFGKSAIKFERMPPAFFRSVAGREFASYLLLRRPDTGALAAFMLCFRIGGRVINKFIGLDYALPREGFVYYQLWHHAVEWASASGPVEFLSGQTGYSAKLRVGHSLLPLTIFARHRNPLVHRVFARITRRVTWASLDADLAEHLTAHPRAGGPV